MDNPLISLAKRAAAGNWNDERAAAEMTVIFGVEGMPESFTDWIMALMSPQLPPDVADWGAKIATQLAAKRNSSRGQGYIASLLATAFMMRGKFGDEDANSKAHHYIAVANSLLPPDDPYRFGLTMMQSLMAGDDPRSVIDQLPAKVKQTGAGRVADMLKEVSNAKDPEQYIASNVDEEIRSAIDRAKEVLADSGAMSAAADISRFGAFVDRVQHRPSDEPHYTVEIMKLLTRAKVPTDLDAIADEYPEIYYPGLIELIKRFIDAGRSANASKLVDTLEERLVWIDQLRARHPIDVTLLDFLEQDGPVGERPAMIESSVLHSWAAVERLAHWNNRAQARGDKATSDLFEHDLCELGRWFYTTHRVADPQPASAWALPLRRYMLDRKHNFAVKAVSLARNDAPAEVVQALKAYEQMDTNALAQYARPAEAVLWSQRKAEDAMLMATLLIDVIVYATEFRGYYTIQQQKESLKPAY